MSNGQQVSENGNVEQGGEQDSIVVVGQYSFIGPDGQTYWVNYYADKDGFHPVVGTGTAGGIRPGQDAPIDPNALRSLIGK